MKKKLSLLCFLGCLGHFIFLKKFFGHFWMFAVKITEWLFSLKSLGLWTHLWTHLPIVWDKVPNKFVFFDTFPYDSFILFEVLNYKYYTAQSRTCQFLQNPDCQKSKNNSENDCNMKDDCREPDTESGSHSESGSSCNFSST